MCLVKKVRVALVNTEEVTAKMQFTRAKLIAAVLFHLQDEGWFPEVPEGLRDWLNKQIPDDKRVGVKRSDWEESKSGTQRMLWLMVAAGIDPYELCKWAKTPKDATAMHRRFGNIIQSWGDRS